MRGLIARAGVRYLVEGEQTGGRVALVEHPIAPRALAAPIHTHKREDEISYVVAGQVGVRIGEHVGAAGPGAVVFKPRGIPYAFWNASDTPALVVELSTPANFEGYFAEMAALFDTAGGLPALSGARGGDLREVWPESGFWQRAGAGAGAWVEA